MRWYHRRVTSRARALPDFLIIGAQKCGTSSLYNLLVEHPALLEPLRKEVHFFDRNFERGPGWYRAHFPLRSHLQEVGRALGVRALTGEGSPYYLFHPRVPGRVAGLVPGAKLIALLRDPVSRAYSHYQHVVRRWPHKPSFAEALAREERELQEEQERMLAHDDYQSRRHMRFSFLARGLYAEQLEAWYAHFPRERLLVLKAEDFFADVRGTVRQVVDFLGLPTGDWEPEKLEASNVGSYKEPLDPELRARLRVYFAPHNARLYELLGRDFGWT
jgi:hypothetical protein